MSLRLQDLAGEDYQYAIDFLFFKRLAEGELRFFATEQPDIFRAELVGRTLGIASWLTGDRTQTYTSLMQREPNGALSSIEHVSVITKKRWGKWTTRQKVRRFDYARGKIFEEKLREKGTRSTTEHEIPDGLHPVDMLTAFYNLRTEVYGPLRRGEKLLIPTYSGKGFVDIEVKVLTVDEQSQLKSFPMHGMLVQATIDPEIFDTGSGNLYVWFDEAGIPAKGIVEDLIGLGDVYGYLEEEEL